MRNKSGTAGLRWFTALALAVCALPMVWTWHTEGQASSTPQSAVSATAETDPNWVSPTEVEVELRDGEGDDVLADLSKKVGAPLEWNSPAHAETEIAHLTVPAGVSEQTILDALRADGRVALAEPMHTYRAPEAEDETDEASAVNSAEDSATKPADDTGRWKPNDPRYNEQWNFQMVKAEEAWEVTRGKGITVAVIDTGVAYKDTRKGKMARDFKQTSFVDGYDFVAKDDMPNDDHGHGTHVSGTIAESTDNNEGVAGLAFEARIMPLKVLSASGGGSSATIAEAIKWAADHGANVINMSLGGPYPDKLMQEACTYAHKKGVTIVCAAGNSGREGVGYPAGYKESIAVSAVGPKGDLSFYSSWGKEVAIAAPGGDSQVGGAAGTILQNTVMRDRSGEMKDDYYGFQGTSMASPHVAAVAALVESKGIKDPDDVKAVLQKSAMKKGPKEKYGAGIVDAAAAVKLAARTYEDGVSRFWLVAALFGGCYVIGRSREKSGSRAGYPFWGTAALSFGLIFPDWLTGYLGMSSHVNIIAHSILIPGALLALGAHGKTERRLLGWMALGLTLHLGWEFLRGTTPVGLDFGTWKMLPWVASNVLVGTGMVLSGLTAEKD
jgi:serine protease